MQEIETTTTSGKAREKIRFDRPTNRSLSQKAPKKSLHSFTSIYIISFFSPMMNLRTQLCVWCSLHERRKFRYHPDRRYWFTWKREKRYIYGWPFLIVCFDKCIITAFRLAAVNLYLWWWLYSRRVSTTVPPSSNTAHRQFALCSFDIRQKRDAWEREIDEATTAAHPQFTLFHK